jgi:hypothetical protein
MADQLPNDASVVVAQIGKCRRCGSIEDLRCGACYSCGPRIDGRKLEGGGHELWDVDNPTNRWQVEVPN